MSSVQPGEIGFRKRALEFRVVNWPLRDDPFYAGSIVAACVAVGIFAGWCSGVWSMGVLSALAVMATVWKLLVPMTCHVGPVGLSLSVFRWQRRILWSDIGRIESRPHGVLIFTSTNSGRQCVRGKVFLPWFGNEDAVTQIREHYQTRFATAETERESEANGPEHPSVRLEE